MEPSDLAKYYLRYWTKDPQGNWKPADNAPTDLWRFILTHLNQVSRNTVYAALKTVESKKPVSPPPVTSLTKWLADDKAAVELCEARMKSAQTFGGVLEQAYKDQIYSVVTKLHEFFQAEINRHK